VAQWEYKKGLHVSSKFKRECAYMCLERVWFKAMQTRMSVECYLLHVETVVLTVVDLSTGHVWCLPDRGKTHWQAITH
jgi:hypothetical protein